MFLQAAKADVHSQEEVLGCANETRFIKYHDFSFSPWLTGNVTFCKPLIHVFSVEMADPKSKVFKVEPELTIANASPELATIPMSSHTQPTQPSMLNVSNILFDKIFPSPSCRQGLQCVPEDSCQVLLSQHLIRINKSKIIIILMKYHTHQDTRGPP